jgi:hypothetical protein
MTKDKEETNAKRTSTKSGETRSLPHVAPSHIMFCLHELQ